MVLVKEFLLFYLLVLRMSSNIIYNALGYVVGVWNFKIFLGQNEIK